MPQPGEEMGEVLYIVGYNLHIAGRRHELTKGRPERHIANRRLAKYRQHMRRYERQRTLRNAAHLIPVVEPRSDKGERNQLAAQAIAVELDIEIKAAHRAAYASGVSATGTKAPESTAVEV